MRGSIAVGLEPRVGTKSHRLPTLLLRVQHCGLVEILLLPCRSKSRLQGGYWWESIRHRILHGRIAVQVTLHAVVSHICLAKVA